MVTRSPYRKVGGHLDVTFADKVYEVGETQATYMTDELN